jgi:hypothetical protein
LVTCALLGYFMIANQLVDLFFVSCSLIAVWYVELFLSCFLINDLLANASWLFCVFICFIFCFLVYGVLLLVCVLLLVWFSTVGMVLYCWYGVLLLVWCSTAACRLIALFLFHCSFFVWLRICLFCLFIDCLMYLLSPCFSVNLYFE